LGFLAFIEDVAMLRRLLTIGFLAAAPALGLAGVATAAERPAVIARDGSAVTFPEATLAALDLAILQGADSLRLDVYQTLDGVLVIRTARDLAATTNAASVLARPVGVKGEPPVVGFPVDLVPYSSYAQLTARQIVAGRDLRFDGMFPAPILEDAFALIARRQVDSRRAIGLLIVLHDTQLHAARGRPMEPRLVAAMQKYGLAGAPQIMIGAGEPTSLQRLAGPGNPRVFVLGPSTARPADSAVTKNSATFGDYQAPEGLRAIRGFADAVLIDFPDVRGYYPDGAAMPPSTIVADAKAAGLGLYVGGFADADDPLKPRREAVDTYARVFALGVDGIVTDEPARAIAARRHGR